MESWLALLSNGLVWLLRHRSLDLKEPRDRRRGACDNVAGSRALHAVSVEIPNAFVTALVVTVVGLESRDDEAWA